MRDITSTVLGAEAPYEVQKSGAIHTALGSLDKNRHADRGAWPKFTDRSEGVASVAAKLAQGRPRRFGSAVVSSTILLASLAWRKTRYALRAALGQMRQV